jgi:hypothetical protein
VELVPLNRPRQLLSKFFHIICDHCCFRRYIVSAVQRVSSDSLTLSKSTINAPVLRVQTINGRLKGTDAESTLLVSHRGGFGSFPGKSVWDLWWIKWKWDRFIAGYSGSYSINAEFPRLLSWAATIGSFVDAAPRGQVSRYHKNYRKGN